MAKILIVEDNTLNMRLAVAVLKNAGYEPLQACNAEEGIELARRERPALILMDIQLPKMDGLEATRILKADAQTADIPIIALTAFAMKGDRERILEAGCDEYLAKPVHYQDVVERIAKLLGRGGQPLNNPQ